MAQQSMPPWMNGMTAMLFPQMMQQPQQPPMVEAIMPVRVNRALEFHTMITQKTMDRPVVSETSFDIVKGQGLTDEEANAFASACNLLSSYFSGRLGPDQWEGMKLEMIVHTIGRGIPWSTVQCDQCKNMAPEMKERCTKCHGSGILMIRPGVLAGEKHGDE